MRCTEHRLFSTQNHNDNQTQVAARLLYSRFIEILRSDARASAERTMLQSFGQLGVRMVRSNEQSASSISQSAKSYWTGMSTRSFSQDAAGVRTRAADAWQSSVSES